MSLLDRHTATFAAPAPADLLGLADPPVRSRWRRVLEARGTIDGFDRPLPRARITTRDGVRLSGAYLPRDAQRSADGGPVGGPVGGPDGGPVGGPDGGPAGGAQAGAQPDARPPGAVRAVDADAAVLLVHGFGASAAKPAYAALARALSRTAPVLSLDLRGHGASGGACTFGDGEVLDVEAAVAWLAAVGHRRVVAVGASMGGAAVLGAAAAGAPLAGVVTISAPARWRDPAPPGPLRELETLWHSPVRRALLRAGLRTRLAPPSAWSGPQDPVRSAGALRQPLLVVHAVDDAYFPVSDAHALVAATSTSSALWLAPHGSGHAEDAFSSAAVRAVPAAVAQVLATGRFPSTP